MIAERLDLGEWQGRRSGTYVWITTVHIIRSLDGTTPFAIWVLLGLSLPLQGFGNMIIYVSGINELLVSFWLFSYICSC